MNVHCSPIGLQSKYLPTTINSMHDIFTTNKFFPAEMVLKNVLISIGNHFALNIQDDMKNKNVDVDIVTDGNM